MAPGIPRRILNDTDVRSLALRIVADEGIDSLSLPRLALLGGFSSAPLYRRYDTGADVATDLWNTEVAEHFGRLLDTSIEWAQDPASPAATWLSSELMAPSECTRAVVVLLATARRLGAQGDEIRHGVETAIEQFLTRESSLPPALALAHITPILGALLLEPVAPFVLPAVLETRAEFSEAYRDSQYWQHTSTSIPYTPPAGPSWPAGDAVLDELRNAAVRVVGRYGVAGATSNRITREAGRSITSAYRRLGNKEELIANSIGLALSSEFGFSGRDNASSMPLSQADRALRALHVLRNQVDPSNRTSRLFVLESLIAARYDEPIRREVTQWFAAGHERFRSAATALGVSDPRTLVARWEFRIVTGIGALLLSVVAQRLFDRFDPMPVIYANDSVCFGGMDVGPRPGTSSANGR